MNQFLLISSLLVVTVLATEEHVEVAEASVEHEHVVPEVAQDIEHHGYVDDYYAYPKYKFEYGVKDPHTGDQKSHWEERDGDVVKGVYSLHEPDGTERVVVYRADKHNGFEAHVKHVSHEVHHPAPLHAHQEYSYLGEHHGEHGYSYSNQHIE
ncbi:cuticle protein 19-like [Anopheles ziemanni]|uniref:cuticle protein 19-like n=1 Tax=Anopheles coustani TaxID=139045 RepID=UPI00265AF7DD|nr:cuticle protein 19-like [Anopheles coustani]XP_058178415.1 cuticle protein 19-like [Anopheles ziemanni]